MWNLFSTNPFSLLKRFFALETKSEKFMRYFFVSRITLKSLKICFSVFVTNGFELIAWYLKHNIHFLWHINMFFFLYLTVFFLFFFRSLRRSWLHFPLMCSSSVTLTFHHHTWWLWIFYQDEHSVSGFTIDICHTQSFCRFPKKSQYFSHFGEIKIWPVKCLLKDLIQYKNMLFYFALYRYSQVLGFTFKTVNNLRL